MYFLKLLQTRNYGGLNQGCPGAGRRAGMSSALDFLKNNMTQGHISPIRSQ